MRSVHELVTAALRRLTVIGQGEEPAAAEMAQGVAIYDEKYAELAADDLVYWDNSDDPDAEEIPELVFGALTRIMAEELAPNVGQAIPSEQAENGAGPLSIGNKGMRMLRRHVARRPSNTPTKIHAY